MHNRLLTFNLRLGVALFLAGLAMFLFAFIWAALFLG